MSSSTTTERKRLVLNKATSRAPMRFAKGPSEENARGFVLGWQAACMLSWVNSDTFKLMVEKKAKHNAAVQMAQKVAQDRLRFEAQRKKDEQERLRKEVARLQRKQQAELKMLEKQTAEKAAKAEWAEWETQRALQEKADAAKRAELKADKALKLRLEREREVRRAAKKAEKRERRSQKKSSKRMKKFAAKLSKIDVDQQQPKALVDDRAVAKLPQQLTVIAMVVCTLVLAIGAYFIPQFLGASSSSLGVVPAVLTPLVILALASGRFTPSDELSPPPSPISRLRASFGGQRRSVPVLSLS